MTTTLFAPEPVASVAPPPQADPSAPFPGQWERIASFFAPGTPRPGGSKKAHLIHKRGGGFVTRANGSPIIAVRDDGGEKTKNWRAVVAHEALAARSGSPVDGTLGLRVLFVFPRPKYHFRSNGQLKATAPKYHTTPIDVLKATRSTEDALTNVLYTDDSRIAEEYVTKVYGDRPGARITLWRYLGEGGQS